MEGMYLPFFFVFIEKDLMDGLDKLINDFNVGGEEFRHVFENFRQFLVVVNARNRLDRVDIFTEDVSPYQNQILSFYIKIGKWDLVKNSLIEYLSDVKKIENNYILVLRRRSDLSTLFRNDDEVAIILGDDNDYDYDRFYGTISNVYQDVISDLNPKNLKELKKIIIEKMNGSEISPESDLLKNIAEEEKKDFVIIDISNIDIVINDEETMDYLLEEDLEDLNSNLKNIGDNAYNIAYFDENYDQIFKELINFFGDKGQYTDDYRYEINVTTSIDIILKEFILEDGSNAEYFGSLLSLSNELLYDKKLRFREIEYPDFHLMKKAINEIFMDYIHN